MTDRRVLGLSLLGLLLGARPAAAESPISKVVVYADRAQVTRTQAIDCAAGAVHFPGLPPTLDPKTLTASLDGAGHIDGLGHAEEPSAPRPQAEALARELRQLDERLAALRSDVEAQRAVEAKARGYQEHLGRLWGEQAITATPPTGGWDAALDLLRQQGLAARRKLQEAEGRQRELMVQHAQVAADLARVEAAARRTALHATVFVRCTGRSTVRLSYVVPHATWRVAYQAHADRARRQLTLVAQAVVQQGTGEDWQGVRLAVSTANLQRDMVPPTIERLYVGARKPTTTTKVLTRRFERREHLSAGDRDADGVPDSSTRQTITVAAAPAGPDLGPALEIEALAKATVPADGREVIVTLDRRTVTAPLVLETVPKLFPFVYDRARVPNPFPFTMLPGPVGLHVGHAFVGATRTKLRASHEPFVLSFGANNEVQVERFVKREQLDGPGVLGSKKRLRHRYQIDVGNWTSARQKIRVLENVPVAQVQDIEVSLDGDTTAPTSYDRTDGIVAWELDLPARTKRTITLAYTITLPAEYVVSGY